MSGDGFSVLDHLSTGVLVLDRAFNVVFWNRQLEAWTGLARAEVQGYSVEAHCPALLDEEWRAAFSTAFGGGSPVTMSSEASRHAVPAALADGGLRAQRVTISSLPTRDPDVFHALVSIEDVTEFKRQVHDYRDDRSRALDELRRHVRAEDRLRATETLFRAMAHRAPVMMWLVATDGDSTFFNSVWIDYTGSSLEEAIGHGWARSVHPDDLGGCLAVFFEAIERRGDFQMEYRLKRHDGEYHWVLGKGTPFTDDAGEFAGYICCCIDIHERKQAEVELQDAIGTARSATQAKSEFLANMSHEIRTPMTAVLGYAELLLDGSMTSEDERREAVLTMKRNCDYLLALLDDILDLSKIEAGRVTVEAIQFSPLELLADVRTLMAARAHERRLDFDTTISAPIPATVDSDPTRLRQILVNLVGNAIKFTDRGQIDLRLRVVERRGRSALEWEVADTGIGMSKEQVERVFRPFTQADNSTTREYGGTGLGLTISKRLAGLLGGDLEVETRPGGGSRFTVWHPLRELAGVEMIRDPQERLSELLEADTPRKFAAESRRLDARILLAEDGIDNQKLLKLVLSRSGAEVIVAENGQVAIEIIEAQAEAGEPFDIVLMDMQMPVLDGYEATRMLRQRGFETPIIALTAHAMSEDRARCLRAGCDDYATKPVDRAQLLDTIGRWLDTPKGDPEPA
ncbi:MAG: PAS domain S-box protein [Deltaproteobacteria bacterium]|nr:PAS domain S-box protein [Deltaproteobacteria bacterium]MBW2413753.1 PAS domain S-box protein [Deltaproteobacteria bacterium]